MSELIFLGLPLILLLHAVGKSIGKRYAEQQFHWAWPSDEWGPITRYDDVRQSWNEEVGAPVRTYLLNGRLAGYEVAYKKSDRNSNYDQK